MGTPRSHELSVPMTNGRWGGTREQVTVEFSRCDGHESDGAAVPIAGPIGCGFV